MFEGETTIEFSQDAAQLMMSQNVSALFNMELEVTSMDYGYSGLKVTFAEKTFLQAQGADREKEEAQSRMELDKAMPDTASEESAL